ncbi:MAG: Uma2 family endonuclease [bacterium]|nr:Uma2 family endonuclease [bacterium]
MSTPAPSLPSRPGPYTVEEYFRLVEDGVLGPDDRVELLEGVIVPMPPANPPHANAVSILMQRLILAVGGRAIVRGQSTYVASLRSAPEPDVAVVTGSSDDYWKRHPNAALLVVEVADTSLATDRLTKAALYARNEVPEYWIVNLRHGRVEVYRRPDAAAGLYRDIRVAAEDETLSLVALPDVAIAVADLLPGRPADDDV